MKTKEFQESELLHKLIDTASICIMTTDPDGTITSINQAGEMLYGYRANEIIGQNIKILFSPRNSKTVIEGMERQRLKGDSWEYEVWRKRRDDTEILTWLSTTYLFNEKNEIIGALGIARDVTNERQDQEKLRILGDLIDTASICIMTTDQEGIITSINQAGELLYGYRAEEIIGKNIKILFSVRNSKSVIEMMDKKKVKGESWDAVVWRRRKDDTEILTWLSTSYLFSEKNEVIGALGIARDITREKESEERLRILGDLIETASICIMTVDSEGRVTNINHAGELLYGYRSDEIIGKDVKILFSSRNSISLIEELDRKRAKGESWDAKVWRKRKDGTEILTWLSTSYLFNEEGKVIGALGIARDITREREVEEKLSYIAELVDSAANCIISTSEDGIITSINQAGEEMFGYRAKELIGKPTSILWPEEIPNELRERLARLSAMGEPWEAETLGKRKNGEMFPIWLATSYLRDEEGEIKGAVGISRDLTPYKDYEQKLLQMAELVESAANCIIATDRNGIITSINRAGERMYGYSPDEIVGRHCMSSDLFRQLRPFHFG